MLWGKLEAAQRRKNNRRMITTGQRTYAQGMDHDAPAPTKVIRLRQIIKKSSLRTTSFSLANRPCSHSGSSASPSRDFGLNVAITASAVGSKDAPEGGASGPHMDCCSGARAAEDVAALRPYPQ